MARGEWEGVVLCGGKKLVIRDEQKKIPRLWKKKKDRKESSGSSGSATNNPKCEHEPREINIRPFSSVLSSPHNAGTNKAASSSTSLNTKTLDDDTENLTHERVPTELKKAIMQTRTEKKLTQSQLAQIINEKPQVIQEYVSGKAIPNQQILSKLV